MTTHEGNRKLPSPGRHSTETHRGTDQIEDQRTPLVANHGPQTPSMMIEGIDVDHTWVIPSHRDREERYKWYQLEKPAQDRTR